MTNSISTRHSGQTNYPSTDAASGTISCGICRAIYAPSRVYAALLQDPPIVLESAFMSMCHFCFRCRRPACPACWDDVHGVCGVCAREAHLSFRTVPSPLSGALFAPARKAQLARVTQEPAPLVCIHYGSFQPAASPIDHLADTPTRPMGRSAAVVSRQVVQPDIQPHVSELATRPGHRSGPWRLIERGLTMLLALVLVGLIALILLALIFASVNTFIVNTLHIDIRAEIAYLWQLVRHLH